MHTRTLSVLWNTTCASLRSTPEGESSRVVAAAPPAPAPAPCGRGGWSHEAKLMATRRYGSAGRWDEARRGCVRWWASGVVLGLQGRVLGLPGLQHGHEKKHEEEPAVHFWQQEKSCKRSTLLRGRPNVSIYHDSSSVLNAH